MYGKFLQPLKISRDAYKWLALMSCGNLLRQKCCAFQKYEIVVLMGCSDGFIFIIKFVKKNKKKKNLNRLVKLITSITCGNFRWGKGKQILVDCLRKKERDCVFAHWMIMDCNF